jgi:hypothetical protein
VVLGIDACTALGIVVNELVANAAEHALTRRSTPSRRAAAASSCASRRTGMVESRCRSRTTAWGPTRGRGKQRRGGRRPEAGRADRRITGAAVRAWAHGLDRQPARRREALAD